jgi:hypothetical protein
MKRLHSLDAAEVSLVPRGAVKRKFLVLKSRTGEPSMTRKEILDLIKGEPDTMKRVEKILKAFGTTDKVRQEAALQGEATKDENGEGPLDERAQTALKAVVRILTPFKDQLSPMLLHEVLDAAGIQMQSAEEQGGEKEGSSRQSPEQVKEEHKIEAMKAAQGAYKSHLQKLGYQKYPENQIAQKDMEGDDECEKSQEKSTDKKSDGDKEVEKKEEGTVPNADDKESVMKSLLSNLPKETKSAIEAVFKSQQELIKKNDELTQKLVETERTAKRKEYVAKAAGFKHLGVNVEELAETMLALSETAPKQLEVIEKMLSSADEQVGKGDLFKEFGSSLPAGGKSTWDKIEKAAEGYVAKSGEKASKAEAVDRFLATSEGKRMYEEYMNDHASNKGRG